MIVRRLLLAALVVVALPGTADAADAALEPPAGDGARHAAWRSGPTTLVVFDDRTGDRALRTVPDCPVVAVGGGRVLLECSSNPYAPRPVAIDIATGHAEELPSGHRQDAASGGAVTFFGIGRRGLLAEVQGYHYRTYEGFDPERGAYVPLADPATAIDLDRPGLTRPLCAPVRRTPQASLSYESRPPYGPMWLAGPWAIEHTLVERSTTRDSRIDSALRVWRCGAARPRTISRSCGCEVPSFGAGLVVWHGPERVRAYALATGKRRSWPAVGRFGGVAQAGRTLFAYPRDDGTGPVRLRVLRWPR